MTDHVTITVKGCVATILWHGSNTHIRIDANEHPAAFIPALADALKIAFLEDHVTRELEAACETIEYLRALLSRATGTETPVETEFLAAYQRPNAED